MGVEDLLQKHCLVEADINVLGERVKGVVQQSERFLDQDLTEGYRPCDPAMIIERVQQLEVKSIASLLELCWILINIIIDISLNAFAGRLHGIGEISCGSPM